MSDWLVVVIQIYVIMLLAALILKNHNGDDMTDNPWHLPVDLRPAEQPELLSVDARLLAAKVALSIVIGATNMEHRHPETSRKWSQRDRLEYIRTIVDNALRRVK